MLNYIKLATKDTFIYSLGNISTKLIGLVLIPLYTDEFSTAEYGVLGMVEITIQIMVAAFSLSLFQALNRWYWDHKYRDKQKSIFFTTLVTLIISSILMIFLFLPFTHKVSQALLDSTEYEYLFSLLLMGAAVQMISRLILALMRLQRKALLFSLTNILKLVITLGLTIYFILELDRGLEGIFEAQIIGFLVFFLVNLKFILRNIRPVFEGFILKEMLSFSYPLAISSVSGVLLTVTDRYALRYIGGLDDMGLYNLGFKVANILKIFVITSVTSAIVPLKFKMMDKPGSKRFYSKIMTYTAYGFIILLLLISLYSKEAIRVLAQNREYWTAYQVVPLLCFAQFFELLRKNANFGLVVEKKTKVISYLTILISTLNIGLNIVLVYYFSAMGAATALLLSQALFFVFIYVNAQRFYSIPYEIKKVMLMIFVGAAIVTISYIFINDLELLPRILLKLLLIILFPVILYFFNFYEPIELNRLKGAWHKWKKPQNWVKNIKNIRIK